MEGEKKVMMTKKRRNAQNEEQHQPRGETGGEKRRRCPWAGLLRGLEHPLTWVQQPARCWLESRKSFSLPHWLLTQADGEAVGSACGGRREQLPLLQPAFLRLHTAARQARSYFLWLNPVARHQSFCLTHQTKCRAIIYHHKHNSRLLPNEGCRL